MPDKPPAKAKTPSKTAAKAGKAIAPPAAGNAPNALQKLLQPSPDLSEIIGDKTLPRGEAVSKLWTYIKSHKLQNPDDRREILADDKLRKVFGKDRATMFEMNKYLSQHLK